MQPLEFRLDDDVNDFESWRFENPPDFPRSAVVSLVLRRGVTAVKAGIHRASPWKAPPTHWIPAFGGISSVSNGVPFRTTPPTLP